MKQLLSGALSVFLCAGRVAMAAPLDDMRRHFSRLEYDQALLAAEEARKSAQSDDERAESWLYEGYVDVALERELDALRAFDQALSLSPQIRPASDTSPRIAKVFERALKQSESRTLRRQHATLVLDPVVPPQVALRAFDVSAKVEGAFDGLTVRLEIGDRETGLSAQLPMASDPNGRYSAHVPADFARPSAELTLSLQLLDHSELFGVPTTTAVRLPEHRAMIEIFSPQRGAQVRVEGNVVGTIPLPAAVPVAPGKIHVTLSLKNQRVTEVLDVRAGEVARATLIAGESGPSKVVIARYTLMGVGAALLIAGAVLAAEAANEANELALKSNTGRQSGLQPVNFKDVSNIQSTGRAYQDGAIAAFAVGGAAALGSIALFIWPHEQSRSIKRLALDRRGIGVRF